MSYDKFEIINRAFKLENVDRIPYSVWKHFPEDDKEPETLVKAQLTFQKKYDSDIMKISISGRAFAADFGAEIGDYDPISGSRFNLKYPVEKIEDWNNIKPADPNSGEFGKIIETMKLVHKEIEGKVPTMMTLFSPFMIASQLDKDIISHSKEDPAFIGDQIKMISSVMTEFIKGAIDAGVDGIFLATQHLNQKLENNVRIKLEFDQLKYLIENGLKESTFLIMHLHGMEPDFDLAMKLPRISGINWHDQKTKPNMIEARKIFSGALLGGLDSESWKNTPDMSTEQNKIVSSIKGLNARGLILSPGCVIPQYVTDETISEIVKLIRGIKL